MTSRSGKLFLNCQNCLSRGQGLSYFMVLLSKSSMDSLNLPADHEKF